MGVLPKTTTSQGKIQGPSGVVGSEGYHQGRELQVQEKYKAAVVGGVGKLQAESYQSRRKIFHSTHSHNNQPSEMSDESNEEGARIWSWCGPWC